MEHLCQRLGIDMERVMAFGDNFNDIEMLKKAGVGIAVASARQEVKKAADKVIDGYENDGVLREMKRLLWLVKNAG